MYLLVLKTLSCGAFSVDGDVIDIICTLFFILNTRDEGYPGFFFLITFFQPQLITKGDMCWLQLTRGRSWARASMGATDPGGAD